MTNQNQNEFDILNLIQEEIKVDSCDKIDTLKAEFNLKINSILATKTKKTKNKNNLLDGFIFFIKYILTSSLVFGVLLVATNYQAYLEIATNYISPDRLQNSSNAMLTSINSNNILKADASEISKEEIQNNWEKMIENKIKEKNKIHSMERLIQDSSKDLNIDIEMVPYENRIVIPKIWKNIPLVDVENRRVQDVKELDKIFMDELANWVVRYPWSARPGEIGNSFIFGHSSNFPWVKWDYNDVFALIDHIVFGDEIIIYYNQKKYVYVIKEKNIVKPGNTEVLKRNNWKSEISIMTCWPIWTSVNRMIVTWELKEITDL